MGERISVKYNYDEYNRTLKFYQRKNKQLGYDSDQIKWEVKEYEQERRRLLNEKRRSDTFGAKYSKGLGLKDIAIQQ